jgi:hypothetical protein
MIADVYIHPELPALVRIFGSDFKLIEHAIAINEEDEIILDAQTTKLYYVVDVREVQLNFDDITRGASMAAHQFKNYRHQNVIENLMIVPNRLYDVAAQSLKSPMFGNLRLKTFYAIEDAFAHIERQLEVSR